MTETITSKAQMYRLLAAGAFGNTTRQHFSVGDWLESDEHARFESWGVRTLAPGGPCRLYCPRDEVKATAERPEFQAAGVNISIMIDAVCTVTLWADVYDSPTGLMVRRVEYPPRGAGWRTLMPVMGRDKRGVAAKLLLQKHLNPNSLADLEALRERFPGHVYELSACDRNLGQIPGRNAVVWEVRAADGRYEKW